MKFSVTKINYGKNNFSFVLMKLSLLGIFHNTYIRSDKGFRLAYVQHYFVSLNIPINYGSLRIISLVSGMGLSLSVTTVIIVIMTFMDVECGMGTRHYVTSSWRICRVSLVCNLD